MTKHKILGTLFAQGSVCKVYIEFSGEQAGLKAMRFLSSYWKNVELRLQ